MGIENTVIPRFSSADEVTLTATGSTLSIKDGGVTTAKLAATVTDEITITNNGTNLKVKDGGITPAKLSEKKYTFCGDESLAPNGGTTTKTLSLTNSEATDVIEFEAWVFMGTGSAGTITMTLGVNDGSARTISQTTPATTGMYLFKGMINASFKSVFYVNPATAAWGTNPNTDTNAVTMASVTSAYITATFNNGGGGGGHLIGAFIRQRKA